MARLPERALLRQLFDYDYHIGALIWRPRAREMFSDDRTHFVWNKRFAGKRAGFLSKYHGKRLINLKPQIFHEHRLIWLYINGWPVPDLIVHLDHDVLNNRIDNLRGSTQSQISCRAETPRTNTSGIKGVHFSNGQYHARIQVHGKRIILGRFDTLIEAEAVRLVAAALLHE